VFEASGSGTEGLVTVGTWSAEGGVEWKDPVLESESNHDVVYNTADNSPPLSLGPYSDATFPSVAKVGLLFPFLDASGKIDDDGAQCLAAFLMAVREINNKTDGVFDDILPNTKLVVAVRSSYGYEAAVSGTKDLIENVFGGTGVHVVIGGGDNTETSASNMLLGSHRTVQIHTRAMDTQFGDGSLYQYKIQTVPVDSFQGMVIQNILCNSFGYSRVSVFATNDQFGMKATMEIGEGTYCPIVKASVHSFFPGTKDFTSDILAAKDAGTTIFLLFMDAETAGKLLRQGYEMGLFREGTQIFGCASVATSATWQGMPKNIAAKVMKGFIGIEYMPKYSLSQPVGKAFLHRWRKQPATVRDKFSRCSAELDDSGTFFYYRYRNDTNGSIECAGLNFTAFKPDGSDMSPFTPHAYDATIAMALGLHDLYMQGKTTVDGDDLHDSLMFNVSFTGTTGYIEIFEGMPDYGYYAEGNREVGHHYRVLNFHPSVFEASGSGTEGLVTVGTWSAEGGVEWKDPVLGSESNHDIIYNTKSGAPAYDRTPDTIIQLATGVRGYLFALGAINLFIVLVISVALFQYRTAKLIKASQPGMMCFILLGGIIGSIRVINTGLDITDSSCISGLWLGHLAFVLVFGGLLIKTWRVNKIINSTSLRRVKITASDVFKIMLGVLIMSIVYMCLLTWVGQPHQSALVLEESNHATKYLRCTFVYSQFHSALFAFEAFILLYGARSV
jgi:ABC-type branched-subunit amino acid transport system substrate-binding protein